MMNINNEEIYFHIIKRKLFIDMYILLLVYIIIMTDMTKQKNIGTMYNGALETYIAEEMIGNKKGPKKGKGSPKGLPLPPKGLPLPYGKKGNGKEIANIGKGPMRKGNISPEGESEVKCDRKEARRLYLPIEVEGEINNNNTRPPNNSIHYKSEMSLSLKDMRTGTVFHYPSLMERTRINIGELEQGLHSQYPEYNPREFPLEGQHTQVWNNLITYSRAHSEVKVAIRMLEKFRDELEENMAEKEEPELAIKAEEELEKLGLFRWESHSQISYERRRSVNSEQEKSINKENSAEKKAEEKKKEKAEEKSEGVVMTEDELEKFVEEKVQHVFEKFEEKSRENMAREARRTTAHFLETIDRRPFNKTGLAILMKDIITERRKLLAQQNLSNNIAGNRTDSRPVESDNRERATSSRATSSRITETNTRNISTREKVTPSQTPVDSDSDSDNSSNSSSSASIETSEEVKLTKKRDRCEKNTLTNPRSAKRKK